MAYRTVILVLVLSLMLPAFCFAQSVRNISDRLVSNEGMATFGNVAVTGLDTQGNPGYIALTSVSTKTDTNYTYILWVDQHGKLKLASYTSISAYSSFPHGNWKHENFTKGVVVGAQVAD